jgi:hypothetical protein
MRVLETNALGISPVFTFASVIAALDTWSAPAHFISFLCPDRFLDHRASSAQQDTVRNAPRVYALRRIVVAEIIWWTVIDICGCFES